MWSLDICLESRDYRGFPSPSSCLNNNCGTSNKVTWPELEICKISFAFVVINCIGFTLILRQSSACFCGSWKPGNAKKPSLAFSKHLQLPWYIGMHVTLEQGRRKRAFVLPRFVNFVTKVFFRCAIFLFFSPECLINHGQVRTAFIHCLNYYSIRFQIMTVWPQILSLSCDMRAIWHGLCGTSCGGGLCHCLP